MREHMAFFFCTTIHFVRACVYKVVNVREVCIKRWVMYSHSRQEHIKKHARVS